MGELLTSLDIVNQAFKKTMRGYDPAEVDEFLDQVAECLQVYAQKTKDYEREIETHLEKLADYEKLKDSLQEALVLAQKTAEERISNATGMADSIVAEARTRAEALIAEANVKAEDLVRQAHEDAIASTAHLEQLESLRKASHAAFRDLMQQISSIISNAEAAEPIKIPEFTAAGIMGNSVIPLASSAAAEPETQEAPEYKMGIADTLSALGIDPKLLDTGPPIRN